MWIDNNEKYAVVGITVKTEGVIPSGKISDNYYVFGGNEFELPEDWKSWLGTIRTEELGNCNLFLLTKLVSSAPEILDAENQKLHRLIWTFYLGLLLSCSFAPAYAPVILNGACRDGSVDVRQQQDLDHPIASIFHPYPSITVSDLRSAASLAENLIAMSLAQTPGGHWRLNRTLSAYVAARTTKDILDRIHQYCRCIEGLILPDPGKSKQQFKSRTELFVGTKHHDLMGDIYDIRSAVEHLHENRYLETFDRDTRLRLARYEVIAEYVARTSIARVVERRDLWKHFGNAPALHEFWGLSANQRIEIWGAPCDPLIALNDCDSDIISNAELGVSG